MPASTLPAPRYESWWQERHQQKLDDLLTFPHQNGLAELDILSLGDSIMHFWEDEGGQAWRTYYGELHTHNLGFGGDCTEHLLWRIQNGEIDNVRANLIVLMIGTNNAGHRKEQPEDIALGVKAILTCLKQRLPKSRILLLGILPRSKKPTAPMRRRVNDTNTIIQDFADNQNVFWLDIGPNFLTADGLILDTVMPDYLHLTSEQYRVWAKAMKPLIDTLLEKEKQ